MISRIRAQPRHPRQKLRVFVEVKPLKRGKGSQRTDPVISDEVQQGESRVSGIYLTWLEIWLIAFERRYRLLRSYVLGYSKHIKSLSAQKMYVTIRMGRPSPTQQNRGESQRLSPRK
jgi:hypothetical protein